LNSSWPVRGRISLRESRGRPTGELPPLCGAPDPRKETMPTFLDFEKPIAELEGKIEELRHLENKGDLNIAEEVARLQGKVDKLLRQTYGKLTAWQKTLVARHPERPHFLDYVSSLFQEFTPLAGDRSFADDRAIQGGLARFRGRPVMIMG